MKFLSPRIAAATALTASAVTMGIAQTTTAACPLPASNGSGSDCDDGDLCLWANDPKDSHVANPRSALSNWNNYCWSGQGYDLDNDATYVKSKWTVPAGIYQNINYNSGNPGGASCLYDDTEYNLKNTDWANGYGSANDSTSANKQC